MSAIRLPLSAVFAMALAACATPKAALDSAAHSAALAASLNVEMRVYREAQRQIAGQRIQSIARQEARLSRDEVELAFEEKLRDLSGVPDDRKLRARIEEVIESLAARDQHLLAAQQELNKTLEKLSVPVPGVAQSLGKVEQTLSSLAEELSIEERLKATRSFVGELRATLKKNEASAIVDQVAPPKDDPAGAPGPKN